ncbi:MAG TPA: hypothetical protein EYQ50_18770 [Verrucomicrobiales bacterium]|nr:hypothetical protein [Verrucomicrobiales bacterium]
MGVNSDDGFLATVSRVHGDSLADSVQVGAHDGGGGATGADPQYPFAFVIEEPGVYAFRMTWWEGTGGANVEWASKDGAGVSHLVNDTASGSPIRAYRTRSEDPPPPPAGVLLVVSSNGANESDLALKADLESRGAIVSVVLADQSIPADAEGRLFVVVSSTVGSGDVTEKFRNATVPVITWEQALQDDFGLTQNDGAFRGTAGSQTSINIVDPDHPLAGGLSAGVHEVSSPSGYSWGIPDPAVDANIVATLVDNPDAAIVYEVPQGGSLIDGTPAAGQRIHIFFSDSTFLALNSDGYAIWNAVIQSAGPTLDDPPAAPIEPPYVVNPEDALNIAFVSFHADSEVPTPDAAAAGFGTASDKIYTDLLVATGHTVTRVVTSNSPDVDALNQFDLVIISRAVSSGHYSNEGATAWTSVTTPSLILGGYVLRTSRMGFTTGTSMVDSTDTITLNVNNPGHPIFNGVALDANGTMVNDFAEIITFGDTVQRGVSVNNNEAGAGGQVLATVANTADPTSGGLVIGEWQTGAVMENGNSDVLGGLRVVLLTGSREQGFTSQGAGIYDLVGDGALLFLNAVGYTGGILNGGGGDQPSISISTDTDGNTVLTFSGTLRGADDADGPYLEVTGAVSPMTITPDAVRKFYQTSN